MNVDLDANLAGISKCLDEARIKGTQAPIKKAQLLLNQITKERATPAKDEKPSTAGVLFPSAEFVHLDSPGLSRRIHAVLKKKLPESTEHSL